MGYLFTERSRKESWTSKKLPIYRLTVDEMKMLKKDMPVHRHPEQSITPDEVCLPKQKNSEVMPFV